MWAAWQIFSNLLGMNMPESVRCLMLCLALAKKPCHHMSGKSSSFWVLCGFSCPWQPTVLPSDRAVLPPCCMCSPGVSCFFNTSYEMKRRWDFVFWMFHALFCWMFNFCTLGLCHLCVPWRYKNFSYDVFILRKHHPAFSKKKAIWWGGEGYILEIDNRILANAGYKKIMFQKGRSQ